MSINNREVYFVCPKCRKRHTMMDYHENTSSENWEVFCVLNQEGEAWGDGPAEKLTFDCPACGAVTDWDYMFQNRLVSVENINYYKEMLKTGLRNFTEYGEFTFSTWEPDMSPAVAIMRLCQMYPNDRDFQNFKRIYRQLEESDRY